MHKCRKCGGKGRVLDTRTTERTVRRRVACNNPHCGERWKTFELHEADYQPLMRARNQLGAIGEIIGKPVKDGLGSRTWLGQEWLVGSEVKQ